LSQAYSGLSTGGGVRREGMGMGRECQSVVGRARAAGTLGHFAVFEAVGQVCARGWPTALRWARWFVRIGEY